MDGTRKAVGSRASLGLVMAAVLAAAAPRSATAESLWDDYKSLLDSRIAEFETLDKWGNTAFPPQGMLAIKYQYSWLRANKRFDAEGNQTKAIAPIDILGSQLDFGLTGVATGHKFQFFYGITNDIALLAEVPFQKIEPSFDVKFTPVEGLEGTLIGNLLKRYYKGMEGVPMNERPSIADPDSKRALEALWLTFESLGRARPNLTVKDDNLKLGDVSVALAWNYLRTDNLSFALGLKGGFPTGKIASPNNSLTYALGPELDIGVGSYSVEIGHILDIRPPEPYRWFVLSFEAYAAYFFESTRPAPHFLEPDPRLVKLLQALSPVLDLDDITGYFPDLSDLRGDIVYRPGAQIKWVAQLAPTFAWWFPLSAGVQGTYYQASEMEGNVPEFQNLVDALGLVGRGNKYELWAKVTLPLLPLYIPGTVSMGFNYYLAGENVLILEDDYDVTVQLFIPWTFSIPGL